MRGAACWLWAACWAAACARARELDPGACAARFDVQRDKIIRTEESRELGARYLSELEVGARRECRHLCCETDACDVFVFEERSPGSCYLFACGAPQDFRCKFAPHANFSSGVLALGRRRAELQDSAPAPPPAPVPAPVPAPTPVPAPVPKLTPTPPTPRRPTANIAGVGNNNKRYKSNDRVSTGRCSRYQFECHTGGECIAVYNACDGVPQCADGSDEAPELGCPAPAPPPAAATTRAPPAAAAPEQAHDAGAAEGARWPHRLAAAQQHYPAAEPGEGPHIFSHKGGLLQEPEPQLGAQFPPFEPPAPWPRRPWPPPPASAPDAVEGGWAGTGYARGEWGEPVRRAWPGAGEPWPVRDPPRAWPVPPRAAPPELPLYVAPKTMPEMPMLYSSQEHALRDAPKKGLGLEPPPAPPAALAPAPPPASPLVPPGPAPAASPVNKKVVLDKAAPAAGGGAEAAGVAAPALLAVERDGPSERPPAAVLLLVLGLGMTGALGALLACRARAARRRRSRARRPLAHDPDYLVNGMYL